MTALRVSGSGLGLQISITPTATVTELLRTDANGTAPVRVGAGVFPRTAALTVTDYEAALYGSVTYRAGNGSVTHRNEPALPCLVPLRQPAAGRTVQSVTAFSAARASLGTVHQGLDRPAPLVALGSLGLRSGSLGLWGETHAEVRALESLIDGAGVVMFKQSENQGQDLYFVALGTTVEPDGDEAADGWVLRVEYQETARPEVI